MNKVALSLAVALTLGAAPPPQGRPAITGISHLAVYSADLAASDHFYGFILGGRKAPDPENPTGARYYFSPIQFVEVLPLPAGQGQSRLAHAAYNTVDAARLRTWLAAHGAGAVSDLHRTSDGTL